MNVLSIALNRERLPYVIIAACIAALLLRLVFFLVSCLTVEPTGDEGLLMLQAKHIWQGKELPLLFWGQPYTFPIESYLNAPFSAILPSNAFGARLLAWLWGLAASLLALAIVRRMGTLSDVWPAYLLILFPSAYWLTMQAAYAPPSYPSYMGLFFLGIFFASLSMDATSPSKKLAWVGLSGFFAGLTCSVTLLAAPLLVGLGLFFMMRGQFIDSLRQAGVFGVSALLGLAPQIIARILIPGAYMAVSENHSWLEALTRIWKTAIPWTLPSSFGIRYPFFPDLTRKPPSAVSDFADIFYIVWLVLFAAIIVLGCYRLIRNTKKSGWLNLDFIHVFTIITVLAIILFGLSNRAYSHSYRYLLPVVMSFPFQVAYLYRYANQPLRLILTGLVIFLVSINLLHSAKLVRAWQTPEFGRYHAEVPSLQGVISFLEENNIHFAYGSWFSAHRLSYATDENIVSGQYYNERFYGWPTPYKDQIDAQENVAFVLDPTRDLSPEVFQTEMAKVYPEVSYQTTEAGFYTVYSDFRNTPEVRDIQITPGNITVESSHNPTSASALLNPQVNNLWRSHETQKQGMFLDVFLAEEQPISRVKLYYQPNSRNHARKLNLLVEKSGELTMVKKGVENNISIIDMINAHPVAGDWVQVISIPTTISDRLRIEIAEPANNVDWSVREIKLFKSRQ